MMTRAERDKLAADIRAQLAGGFRRRGRAHWATLAVEYLHQILAALEDAEAETDALYVALLRASTQTVTNRESGGASPAGAPGASTEAEAPEAPRPPALDRPGGDAEDWAVVRVAELRSAGEVARIVFRTDGPGGRDRSVAVMRQDGKIEDPPPVDKPGGASPVSEVPRPRDRRNPGIRPSSWSDAWVDPAAEPAAPARPAAHKKGAK